MHILFATHDVRWFEWLLVLALGAMLIVVLAGLVAGRVRSAWMQSAIWQVALLGLAGWLALEATGASQAVWGVARLGVLSLAARSGHEPSAAASDAWPAESVPSEYPLEAPPQAAVPAPIAWPEHSIQSDCPTGTSVPAWLCGVWLLGTLGVAIRVACSRWTLARFVRRMPRLGDLAVARRVAEVSDRLGFARRVRLLEAEGLAAPVAFGVWRPSVALPTRFGRDFDPQQQQAILAHELAHLAAHDPAWQLLADLLCAVLWWHPAVWWARARLRAASEAAADEASAVVPEGPSILAGCLVAFGRRLGRSQRLVWLSAEGNGFRSGLGRRVERLLNHQQTAVRRPGRGRLAMVWAGLPASLMLTAVLGTAWARPQALAMEGETMVGVLRSSWQGSLGAVALAALLAPGLRDAAADEGRPGAKEKPPAASQQATQQSPAEKPKAEKPLPPSADKEGEPRGERGRRPPPGAEGPRGEERADGEAIHRRLQEIRERAERLRSEGKMEDVEQLKEEARQLMRRAEGMREGFRGRGGPGEGRPEVPEHMRRFWHLRAAMENLRAGGMTEMADKVREQLDAIEREHPEVKRGEGRPWRQMPREQFQPGAQEGPRPSLPELQELRQQMERMHREMQEMREQFKQRGERRE